jgi:hypothetical protein
MTASPDPAVRRWLGLTEELRCSPSKPDKQALVNLVRQVRPDVSD